MKNLLVLLVLIVFLQSEVQSQANIGVIGGTNIASFKADEDITSRWLWGSGLVINYGLINNFSLRTGLVYMKKGGVQEQNNDNPRITIDQSFLELPLLAKYDFGDVTTVYFLAGASIGYLLTSELEADVNGFLFTADMEKLTETLDVGLCFGTGVNVPIENNNLFLEVKYSYGLTNLAIDGKFTAKSGEVELEGEFDEDESKYSSRGLQLFIGFTFSL